MYECPYCDFRVQEFEICCPRCGGDLKTMALLNELPHVQFNLALRAAKAGDWATATMLAASVLATRVHDAEAWLLLGLVWARQEWWQPARVCFDTVLMLQRNDTRAKAARDQIERILAAEKAAASKVEP